MAKDLLPVGTVVQVTQSDRVFVAKVVGYDMFRTKYQLGARFAGWNEWHFAKDGSWAFLSEVETIPNGGSEVSNCSGTPDSRGWCPACGGGHESAEEMATRLDLTRKTLRLLDRIHGGKHRTDRD
jgi:hypothetical protein